MFIRAALRLLAAITALLIAAAAAEYSYKRANQQADSSQWIDGLANAVGMLGDIIGDVDNCKYSCKKGLIKFANARHIPVANGCGNKDYPLEVLKDYPGITQCCNKHDICYDTCNNDKAYCDRVFKQCLDSYCYNNGAGKDCSHFSKLAYGAVGLFSCPAYMDSQKAACVCR